MHEIQTDLLPPALAGDPRAVRELVGLLTPVIQARVARSLLRRRSASRARDVRQEVEDLAQDVLVALFSDGARSLRQWEPSRGMSLLNFVGLLAEREVASILRSRRKSPRTEDPTEDDALDRPADSDRSPERQLARHQSMAAVVAAVRERLTERGRELFGYLVLDGRTVEEVCALTGMNPDAVYAWRSRLGRLVREVSTSLSGSHDEPRSPLGSPT